MRFAKKLDDEAVPEWRPKYVQYTQLKRIIDRIPTPMQVEYDPSLGRYMSHERDALPLEPMEEVFLDRVNQELEKVVQFYATCETTAMKKKDAIFLQVQLLDSPIKTVHTSQSHSDIALDMSKPDSDLRHTKRRIRRAILEFYKSLELLSNYRTLNLQAFAKIMKKFDKATQRNRAAVFMEAIRGKNFVTSTIPDSLVEDIENLYRRTFTDGNRSKALRDLRTPDVNHVSYEGTAMASGFLFGLISTLLLSVIRSALKNIDLTLIYGGLGLPLLLAELFIINIWIWNSVNVNYKFVFELNHRSALHLSEFSLIVHSFVVTFLLYANLSISGVLDSHIQQHWQPWIAVGVMSALLFLPLPVFFCSSRVWMIRVGFRMMTSPFRRVHFADFFINDQLMSLLFTFQMLGLMVHITLERSSSSFSSVLIPKIWYVSLIASIPVLGRMVQCYRRWKDENHLIFPHLINLIKYLIFYSIAWITVGESRSKTLFITKLVLLSIGSLFSYAWDIFMDFGLMQGGAVNFALRETIAYPFSGLYYCGMIFDFACRMAWILPILNLVPSKYPPLAAPFGMAVVEVIRKFVWNCFRVEFEHVNNCNAFRAYADIALPNVTRDLFYHDMVAAESVEKEQNQEEVAHDEEGRKEPSE